MRVFGSRLGRSVVAMVVCAGLVLGACSSPAPEMSEPGAGEGPAVEAPPAEDPAPPPDPAPEPAPPEPEPEPEPALGSYGVSAGDPAAIEAGMRIIEDGGNAVDAAVATALAVAVVEPFASGIGGGGHAVLAWPDAEPLAYDFREVVAQDGRVPASNVGIPGLVAGMGALLDDHGTLELAEVLQPAIRLARDGTPTSETLATQLRNAAHRLPVGQLPHLYPGGTPLSAGAQLVQEELADTLELLADEGVPTFYEGTLADDLAGVEGIDRASLAAYEVQRSVPASGSFAGYQVHAAAPPLPGAALVQMLQVAEALGVEDQALDSADLVHTIAMAWRLADRSIASHLGDPAFVDVPVDELTDPARNAEMAATIPRDGFLAAGQPPTSGTSLATAGWPSLVSAPMAGSVSAGPGPDAGNTTHLTVVDAEGAMVSMTNTLTNFWGSGRYVRGFFLNDQLRRFSVGGSGSNVAEPGRRSVSWSLPALVTDPEGRPVLGLGTPGGRRIPIVLAQVLIRWALHGQSLEDAVAAPRFHLEGAELHVEEVPPESVVADLLGRGYASVSVPGPPYYFGSVQALEVDHAAGSVSGARDTRREADWAARSP